MVKVNLEYNPYLMTFKMLFNGKEPRINSLVEKYEKYPLQSWVSEVPKLMRDEMNGYDFDFEFVGTEHDYQDILKAFKKKRVNENQVRCFLKKKLESRSEKLKALSDLAEWLENNTNRKFDMEKFKIENPEIFYNTYSLVVIGEREYENIEYENAIISVERVSGLDELDNTELDDVPIVIDVDNMTNEVIQTLIYDMMKKRNVREEQLFFLIKKNGRSANIARFITDVGIKVPKIISDLNDEKLLSYIEYYPVSNYIRECIVILRETVDDLDLNISKERAIFEKNNGDVIEEITKLEEEISKIKDSLKDISDIKNNDVIVDWNIEKDKYIEKINTWKSKKTKITNTEEAENLAGQLEEEVAYAYSQFTQDVENTLGENKECLLDQCNELYRYAVGKTLKEVGNTPQVLIEDRKFEFIKREVLKLKEEVMVKKEDGFVKGIGKILGKGSNNPSTENEEIQVTTYFCQAWRDYVKENTKPAIEEYINISDKEVQDYKNLVTEKFIGSLEEKLTEKNETKDKISEQLSEDILLSQKDSDWLVEFKDRLKAIERN